MGQGSAKGSGAETCPGGHLLASRCSRRPVCTLPHRKNENSGIFQNVGGVGAVDPGQGVHGWAAVQASVQRVQPGVIVSACGSIGAGPSRSRQTPAGPPPPAPPWPRALCLPPDPWRQYAGPPAGLQGCARLRAIMDGRPGGGGGRRGGLHGMNMLPGRFIGGLIRNGCNSDGTMETWPGAHLSGQAPFLGASSSAGSPPTGDGKAAAFHMAAGGPQAAFLARRGRSGAWGAMLGRFRGPARPRGIQGLANRHGSLWRGPASAGVAAQGAFSLGCVWQIRANIPRPWVLPASAAAVPGTTICRAYTDLTTRHGHRGTVSIYVFAMSASGA